MKTVLLGNATRPQVQAIRARYCDSFFCRLRGLMFQRALGANEGLLMVQPVEDRMNASIHMLFMNFDLAVVWLDGQKKVVDVQLCKRWRPAYLPVKAARYVFETHPSRLNDFHPGDQVTIEPCP